MADIFRVAARYEPWMAKITHTYNKTSPKTWRTVEQSSTTWRIVQILKSPKTWRTVEQSSTTWRTVQILKSPKTWRTVEQSPTTWRTVQILKSP